MSVASVPSAVSLLEMASPGERHAWLREAREALRLGVMPDGQPMSRDSAAFIESYVEREANELRPRLVSGGRG